jgi:hypothetical protein
VSTFLTNQAVATPSYDQQTPDYPTLDCRAAWAFTARVVIPGVKRVLGATSLVPPSSVAIDTSPYSPCLPVAYLVCRGSCLPIRQGCGRVGIEEFDGAEGQGHEVKGVRLGGCQRCRKSALIVCPKCYYLCVYIPNAWLGNRRQQCAIYYPVSQ